MGGCDGAVDIFLHIAKPFDYLDYGSLSVLFLAWEVLKKMCMR